MTRLAGALLLTLLQDPAPSALPASEEAPRTVPAETQEPARAAPESEPGGAEASRDPGASEPYLGILILAQDDGVVVDEVLAGFAAEQAGLEPGDRLLELEGQPLGSLADLRQALAGRRPGDEIGLRLERDGEPRSVSLRLSRRPDQEKGVATPTAPTPGRPRSWQRVAPGEAWGEDSGREDTRGETTPAYLGVYLAGDPAGGVRVARPVEGGPAERAGLEAGDTLLRLDGLAIADESALRARLAELPAGRTVRVDVLRDGEERSVSVELGARPDEDRSDQDQGPDRSAGDFLARLLERQAREQSAWSENFERRLRELSSELEKRSSSLRDWTEKRLRAEEQALDPDLRSRWQSEVETARENWLRWRAERETLLDRLREGLQAPRERFGALPFVQRASKGVTGELEELRAEVMDLRAAIRELRATLSERR